MTDDTRKNVQAHTLTKPAEDGTEGLPWCNLVLSSIDDDTIIYLSQDGRDIAFTKAEWLQVSEMVEAYLKDFPTP